MTHEIHYRFEYALRLHLANQHQCKVDEVHIEKSSLGTDRITGHIQRENQEKQDFELDYHQATSNVLMWLLEKGSLAEADGYHDIVSIHRSDIEHHMGFWLTSKISDNEMSFVAQRLYTDAMGEDLEYAIRFLFEDHYAEWYNAPQAQLEQDVRSKLSSYGFYGTDTIPVETWLELLNAEPIPDAETVVLKILDYLATHGTNPENITAILETIAFENFYSKVKKLGATLGQSNYFHSERINFYTEQITEDFNSGRSAEESWTKVGEYMKLAHEMLHKILGYTELFAREGQNILILQSYPPERRSKLIRDAVIKGDEAETCFEELVIAAAEHLPELAEIDTDLIVYITELADFEELRNENLSLSALRAYSRDRIPPYEGLVIYVLNHKIELVDILVDISERFSASHGQLKLLSLILNQESLTQAIAAATQADETILSIEEWIEQYQVQVDEDGSLIEIDFDDKEQLHILGPQNRIWTEYDNGIIENRIGFVNRLRYLIANNPHPGFQTKPIYVIRSEPNWENTHYEELELQIDYAARRLPAQKSKAIETIRQALEEAFSFIQDELEVASGDDKSHWTSRLQELYNARIALKLFD